MNKSKIAGLALSFFVLAVPVYAHEVEVGENIGSTLHIEPDDKPRAGEPAQAWFLLTQSGGKLVPFAQCNCQLAIYKQPTTTNNKPILQPTLKAINAEQYKDVPGTEIVFPSAGAYELRLTGSPLANADFKPFEFKYSVTVSTGKSVATATPTPSPNNSTSSPSDKPSVVSQAKPEPQKSESTSPIDGKWILLAFLIILGLGAGVLSVLRNQNRERD